jgi:hypothetical protein
MAKTFKLPKDEPLLDIASYARGGLRGTGGRLSLAQIEHIRRTVQRVPEAVVKVLPRDSNDFKVAGRHLDYIGRYGELELEGEDGQRLQGRIGKLLLEDWDLDIDEVRRQATLSAANGRKSPKLVHKLMFSMPPGTPPQKVLAAVRNFAREEFWGQHRYAFVLHTDEAHPHVHLVLRAMSEQGVRLNIKKATLRHWRSEFARHLRLLGVAANATERAVRGESRTTKKDSIYRAGLRGDSAYLRAQVEAVAGELLKGKISVEPSKSKIVETRRWVEAGWRNVSEILVQQGQTDLATQVRRFVGAMSLPGTEKERVAAALLETMRPRKIERTLTP